MLAGEIRRTVEGMAEEKSGLATALGIAGQNWYLAVTMRLRGSP